MTAKVAFVCRAFVTSLLATVTLTAQNVPLSKQTGTGAISGVVIDANTKKPIAGAEVYLGMAGYGPVGSRSRHLTDAKGRFVYTNLPAADIYFMNASKAGYVNGHYGDRTPTASSLAAGRIKLADGQWFEQATIMLWRLGTIAGTISDERGEPIVGAFVRLLSRITVAGTPHLAAGPGATTDDRGRYRIASLTPGTYLLNVPSVQTAVPMSTPPVTIEGLTPDTAADSDAPRRNNGALALDASTLLIIGNYATPPATGGAPQAYPSMFYPGVSILAAAGAIDIKAGDTRDGIDVVIRPVPTARVSGRVIGAPGAVAGMVLRLVASGLADVPEGNETATTITTNDGRFTFLNVPAGDYQLVGSRASLEYHVGRSSSPEAPRTPGSVPGPGTFLGGVPSGPPGTNVSGRHERGDVNVWARLPISVGNTDVTDLAVSVRNASSMRGRIAWDGDGAPPGATAILAEPADGSTWLGMPQTAQRASLENPQFSLAGFRPGEYILRVVGLTPKYIVRSVMIGGRDVATRPFDMSSGQDVDDVVITLTDRVPTISGVVDTGTSDAPMVVMAFPMERDQWTRYGFAAPRFRTTGVSNTGSYTIENIPAGRYYLIAVDATEAARWQDPAFLVEAAKTAESITVGWGEAATKSLKVSVIK